MTESPSPPEKTPKPKSSPSKSAKKPSKGGGSWLGSLLWRLVFLGLVGVLGTGLGAALAVLYPDRNPQAPFLDTALRSLGLIGETRVPESNPLDTNLNNNLNPSSPSPSIVPSVSPNTSIIPTPTPPSSPQALNQELQQELQQVQQEARELIDRTARIEQQLGNPSPDPSSNLETRLNNLAQQLAASPSPAISPTTSPTNSSTPTPSPTTSPTRLPTPSIVPSPVTPLNPSTIPLGSNQQKITLPPDTLFDRTTDNNILRPEAIILLSQVVNELRGISGTTIQVTAHTNLGGDAARDRILSFQQAKAIREYLATQLGDQFRFVTIGYGNTRPLTTTAAAGQPENRRIEIIVE